MSILWVNFRLTIVGFFLRALLFKIFLALIPEKAIDKWRWGENKTHQTALKKGEIEGGTMVKSRSITTTTSTPKKKRGSKSRSDALLFKPNERWSIAEVPREIRNNARSEADEVDVKFVRRTRTGDILVELWWNVDKKYIPSTKRVDSSLELIFTLEIRDLDCRADKEEIKEVMKIQEPQMWATSIWELHLPTSEDKN